MSKASYTFLQAIEKFIKSKDSPNFISLVKQLASAIPPDEMDMILPEDVYKYAQSLWEFGKNRPKNQPKIRLLHPRLHTLSWQNTHTVIEVVNDDMPFLVDSITAEINRLGYSVYLILHPILKITRDEYDQINQHGETKPESFMHIKINEFLTPEELKVVEQNILSVLTDVRLAVTDWQPMHQKWQSIAPYVNAANQEEVDFVTWLQQNHFTFLGYRCITFGKQGKMLVEPKAGLGILRDATRVVFSGIRDINDLPEAYVSFLHTSHTINITKTNKVSTVHRSVPMDCIDVKQLDAHGKLVQLHRFVGLFTSKTYSDSALTIPIIRNKLKQVLEKADFDEKSHNGKALLHILESFPRDELYQISEEELLTISLGILHLQERQRVALFHRVAPNGRFISCFVFIPRDKYNLQVRQKVQTILETRFRASVKMSYVHVADEALARLYFVLETESPQTIYANAAIEDSLRQACLSWDEQLKTLLNEKYALPEASVLYARYSKAFPLSYHEHFQHAHSWRDIRALEALYRDESIKLCFFASNASLPHYFGLKIYALDNPLPLSDILPVLENLGLHIISENPYEVTPNHSTTSAWIHYFEVATKNRQSIVLEDVELHFQDAVHHIWAKICENDKLNQLVLTAMLNWREVTILRAYTSYMKQIKFSYDHDAVINALINQPDIARTLINYFLERFYPLDKPNRAKALEICVKSLEDKLNTVESLADDRILRKVLELMQATLRTSYFQEGSLRNDRPYLSLKFDGGAIADLPPPTPYREIFVYSPQIEAVHLRGGKVSRGGIRWSDRKEDFRTEILGLLKAQRVKNAVIVPSGAKGGFIVKTPLDRSHPEQTYREVERCYRLMINGLLDLTDNIVDGICHPPENVYRYDGDDPYLVVAADKGTATFSDTANSLAEERHFWLGDAFASGGSSGYDHKKMGITARGAWEAVKRHFREMGKDIQKEDFTVIGVGDMSGDVFGNGMLLSPHICLIAAFNHQHIFIDPNPDTKKSFAERQRLFALPRSSWTDYKPEALSKGGAIYSRSEKSITPTAEITKRLGIKEKSLTPASLIRYILTYEAELLWFGGIGTFVRASYENNDRVSDKTNDALRIDATMLRAKVIGEGANLGLTQAARIEYGLRGGRLNTDAIDNSGGVDCSDHEVNIKITLNALMQAGTLSRDHRDALLRDMTDTVASLVLRNNYLQTQALSMMEEDGYKAVMAQQRLVQHLESSGLLDRHLEGLPTDSQFHDRFSSQKGLTRPELAVIMAYAKLELTDNLIRSKLPDEAHMQEELLRYFPRTIQKAYQDALLQHHLKREIIATVTANSIINRMGACFVHDMASLTNRPFCDIVRCYTIARDSFALRPLWKQIEELDTIAPSNVQNMILKQLRDFMSHTVLWLLHNSEHPINVTQTIKNLKPKVEQLTTLFKKKALKDASPIYHADSIDNAFASTLSAYANLAAALDIIHIADSTKQPLQTIATIYQQMEKYAFVQDIHLLADSMSINSPLQQQALIGLKFELSRHLRALTERFSSANSTKKQAAQNVLEWLSIHEQLSLAALNRIISEAQASGQVDLATILVATRYLANMAEKAPKN